MGPKVGRKFKTKANRTTSSSFALTQVNKVRFPTAKIEEF